MKDSIEKKRKVEDEIDEEVSNIKESDFDEEVCDDEEDEENQVNEAESSML